MTEEELETLYEALDALSEGDLLKYVADRCYPEDILRKCGISAIDCATDDDVLDAAADIISAMDIEDREVFARDAKIITYAPGEELADIVTAMLPADRERLCAAIMDASAHDIRLILE